MTNFTLARPGLDFGLPTDHGDEMCAFYEKEAGLPQIANDLIMEGQREIFYQVQGSWLKLNTSDHPLQPATTGYRKLWFADASVSEPTDLTDPDGLPVTLVPPGTNGIDELGLSMAVNNIDKHIEFFVNGCDGTEVAPNAWRVGNTTIFLEKSAEPIRATPIIRRGFTMLTFVVVNLQQVHDHLLANGASHGMRISDDPGQPGRCNFSFIADPDGNWIELVEFATPEHPLPSPSTPNPMMDEFFAFRDFGTPA
jgi:catechol 2,3-dioxygenase-like lactoylglutathione lyase family enzyme